MIGAFHQPHRGARRRRRARHACRERELVAGLAEVIKYGAVADDAFLDWIEANLAALLARDKPALVAGGDALVPDQGSDRRPPTSAKSGVRAVLNFGHTFGHAIEAGLGYGDWLHGEAVGCGMVMAADLSLRLGLIGADHAARIARVVAAAGLPLAAPSLGVPALPRADADGQEGGRRRACVSSLLEGPGRAAVRHVDEAIVAATIESFEARVARRRRQGRRRNGRPRPC